MTHKGSNELTTPADIQFYAVLAEGITLSRIEDQIRIVDISNGINIPIPLSDLRHGVAMIAQFTAATTDAVAWLDQTTGL